MNPTHTSTHSETTLSISASRSAGVDLVDTRGSRWNRRSVAGLTRHRIAVIATETLIEIIDEWSEFLPQPGVRDRLEYLDRDTLQRLVYLIRQVCRHRIR